MLYWKGRQPITPLRVAQWIFLTWNTTWLRIWGMKYNVWKRRNFTQRCCYKGLSHTERSVAHSLCDSWYQVPGDWIKTRLFLKPCYCLFVEQKTMEVGMSHLCLFSCSNAHISVSLNDNTLIICRWHMRVVFCIYV